MKSFEVFLSTPMHHFIVYFIITFLVSFLLKHIFKKDTTYCVIFLSSFVLFSSFSKDLFTDLPLAVCDFQNVVSNLLGSLSGILVEKISRNKTEKSRRLT